MDPDMKFNPDVQIPKLIRKRGKPKGHKATKPRYYVEVCNNKVWEPVGFYPTHLAVAKALNISKNQAQDLFYKRYECHHKLMRVSKVNFTKYK